MRRFVFWTLLTIFPAGVLNAATVIELTQTGCQFIEPEGRDAGYKPASTADCRRINALTGEDRLKRAVKLVLAPGDYVFRVRNRDVPYELGFWLRGRGLGRLSLPSASGGGIHAGEVRDFHVHLVEGEYLYSCPLNPTPDYPLVVRRER